MVLFPTAQQLSASFNPHSANYWINAPNPDEIKDKSVSTAKSLEHKAASFLKPDHKIELYSAEYFKYCTLGGIIACGPTHSLVTPLDLVKVRRQVNSSLYKTNAQAFKTIAKTEGVGAIFTGIGATFIGYSFQGAGKYGLYEVFKYYYGQWAGEQVAAKYQTPLFLAASASAEFFADIALCPWEVVKVRTQTTMPPYASNVFSGVAKVVANDGVTGLWTGLAPLWARQIPYTMVKFATFENFVSLIYSYLPKEKDQYSKVGQTGVSFVAGYAAGICCAVVSHPADVMVSKINNEKNTGESTAKSLARIYGKIGFAGLWNGLGTRIVMVGTLTALQWLIYDTFKVSLGLPTSGGH